MGCKTNVCIGKFIDQTFHIVACVRACAPWKFIDAPVGVAPSGVFKGRKTKGVAPLRCYARKFSLFLMKNLIFTHIMYYRADH